MLLGILFQPRLMRYYLLRSECRYLYKTRSHNAYSFKWHSSTSLHMNFTGLVSQFLRNVTHSNRRRQAFNWLTVLIGLVSSILRLESFHRIISSYRQL